MAEGGGNLESFMGAPAGSEKAQESAEQFSEQQRRNAAAAAQQKRDEGAARAQDDVLGRLIVHWLQQSERQAHFLLISRLLAKNIPSDFLLAILVLIEPSVRDYITEKLQHLPAPKESGKSSDGAFPPAVKTAIDQWTNGISLIARSEARRLQQAATEADGAPNAGLTQLFVLVLREYLEAQTITMPTDNIRAFGELFWGKLFGDLQKLAGGDFRLGEGV